MITKEEIIEIGKFQKTHALKGELNALLDIDGSFLEDGNPIIVDMEGIYVPFYDETIRTKGAESYLVKLKGIDNQEEAQKLVNKLIYAKREDLKEFFGEEELEMADDFIGYEIVDLEAGALGRISGIEDSTANVLFEVETASGDLIFVPAAEEFIVSVDDDKRIIETDLPTGLINLNSKKD